MYDNRNKLQVIENDTRINYEDKEENKSAGACPGGAFCGRLKK
jgi:hypothetical protein